jgi:hypothetical protein
MDHMKIQSAVDTGALHLLHLCPPPLGSTYTVFNTELTKSLHLNTVTITSARTFDTLPNENAVTLGMQLICYTFGFHWLCWLMHCTNLFTSVMVRIGSVCDIRIFTIQKKGFKYSRMLHHINWYEVTSVLKDHNAFVFRVQQPKDYYKPCKCWQLFNKRQGITSQKTCNFSFTSALPL